VKPGAYVTIAGDPTPMLDALDDRDGVMHACDEAARTGRDFNVTKRELLRSLKSKHGGGLPVSLIVFDELFDRSWKRARSRFSLRGARLWVEEDLPF